MTKKTKDELQVRYREIQDRMGELNVTAAEGKRELTADELREWNALTREAEMIQLDIQGQMTSEELAKHREVVSKGEQLREYLRQAKEAGAKRALMLPVGGAFHSPLMQPAAEELAAGIESVQFKVPVCPVYQNVTALPTTDPVEIKKNLLAQLTAPVKWTQTVVNMLSDGADEFVELGPGTVLQGLVSKIIKNR